MKSSYINIVKPAFRMIMYIYATVSSIRSFRQFCTNVDRTMRVNSNT
jgi:hypothetical protein